MLATQASPFDFISFPIAPSTATSGNMFSAVNVNADGQLLCSFKMKVNSFPLDDRKINNTVIKKMIRAGIIAILIDINPLIFHKKTRTNRKPKISIPHQNGIVNNSKVAPPPANITTVVENKYKMVITSYTCENLSPTNSLKTGTKCSAFFS